MRPDRPTRNIFFYDIPAHWNEADIIIYLRKVRIVNVKANIVLNEDKEEEFAKGTFGTNRGTVGSSICCNYVTNPKSTNRSGYGKTFLKEKNITGPNKEVNTVQEVIEEIRYNKRERSREKETISGRRRKTRNKHERRKQKCSWIRDMKIGFLNIEYGNKKEGKMAMLEI
ncbi:hypothetical protein RhiirB3_446679 [Rhizophagus irregularis]|nr:hypothetical protein RhiirB3_446679 [Rhizophagus irregularis]